MIHVCAICEEPIKDKAIVRVQVTTRYKSLPSKIAFALIADGMVAHPETLVHEKCLKGEPE